MPKQQMPPEPELTILKPLLAKLPPMIARKEVKHFTGGVISPQTLANADNTGTGPAVRYRINDSIVYPTSFLLHYLEKKGVQVIVTPTL